MYPRLRQGEWNSAKETFEIAPMLEDVVATIQPLVEKNANTLTALIAN
jgi:hypothetical protein